MALSSERNRQKLLETILTEAQQLCHADGGTLYLRTEEDALKFEIIRNSSLDIELGVDGSPQVTFPPLSLYSATGEPNLKNVATYAVHEKRLVHVLDAYDTEGFDFSGTVEFDRRTGYRSRSFLTIPLINGEEHVIGVLQLLNAKDPATGKVVPFREEHCQTVAALASQAALALDNKLLIEAQQHLLESFIRLIATAIDSKSPYTGGHCERVPVLTEMLTQSLCEATSGPYADFSLTEEEWAELRIAAWLHDCGKVTTPVHVMDKATKLETIFDRIESIEHRFEGMRKQSKIEMLEAILAGEERTTCAARHEATLTRLEHELNRIRRANIGGEFLSREDQAAIREIGAQTYSYEGKPRPLLSDNELDNLCISKGTLTDDERLIVNGHMVQTVRMLDSLPFPRNLRRVPEYAGGHHEKMDGGGYPRGTYAADMSIPARVMAIADVFEALTAADRPYKKAKKLSETMKIMGFMKQDNHLDPDLFDQFVASGVYRRYAEEFLTSELIDDVDEAALLAIRPRPFETPSEGERLSRRSTLLPQYVERFPERGTTLPQARGGLDRSRKVD